MNSKSQLQAVLSHLIQEIGSARQNYPILQASVRNRLQGVRAIIANPAHNSLPGVTKLPHLCDRIESWFPPEGHDGGLTWAIEREDKLKEIVGELKVIAELAP